MPDGSLDFGQRKDVFHQLCHFGACEIFDLRGKALNRAAQIAKTVGALLSLAFLQILLSVLQTLQLVMYQQRYQTDKRKQDCYICGSYKKRTADCTAHFIRTDLLTAGVLDNLRKVTAYAQKHEARFVKLLIQQNEMGGKRKQAAATKQLEQVQSRIAELSRYIKRLYEDNVNGKINDERFMEMSADYEAEQRELKEKAAALQGELDKAQEATVNAEKFMNVVRKYLSIEELTHTLLREMVEKIVVYECEYDENEVRHQRIDIYYSFVGKIDLPEE